MKVLPSQPTDNERVLGQVYRERFTNSTATSLTLTYTPLDTSDGVSLVQVFKNGLLLDHPSAYTIDGPTITLGSALIVSDIVQVCYPYRG